MRPLLALLVGLVVGSCGTLVPVAADQARHDESEHIKQAEVQCRGNGAGGYRKCMIRFEKPARKVAVDVYVGDRFDMGFVWQPSKGLEKIRRYD